MTDSDAPSPDRFDADALPLLRAIALRVDIARRLVGESTEAVLRTVVEAAVTLFGAEAASIALYDPASDRLVFRVAAGSQGDGVVGLSVTPSTGIVGYVFSTGQAIAQSDLEHDSRFGRDVAATTGYVPRSLVAVPLVDERGAIGVLEVLDKVDSASFSIRDIELASVFAHQAAVAITESRVERDTAALLAVAIRTLLRERDGDAVGASVDAIAATAAAALDGDDDRLWALVEQVARVRDADPDQLDLVVDLLAVVARRAEADRSRHRDASRMR